MVIAGTISAYGGSNRVINIDVCAAVDRMVVELKTVDISGESTSYSVNVAGVGNYLVVAADYAMGSGTPEAGNYIGTYGWEGTQEIAAAGNQDLVMSSVWANAVTVEVTSETTAADFSMHQISEDS